MQRILLWPAAAAYAAGDDEIEIERESVSLKKEKEKRKTLDKAGGNLQWIAVTNKFFAAVVRPLPQEDQEVVDYVDAGNIEAQALEYVDDKDKKRVTPAVLFHLKPTQELNTNQNEITYKFRVYLGPISRFGKNSETAGMYVTITRSVANITKNGRQAFTTLPKDTLNNPIET